MASGFPYLLNLAQKQTRKPPLRFREDGTFHILQLSDVHLVDPEMDDDPDRSVPLTDELRTFEVLEKSVDMLCPDLAVLTGDVVNGYWEEMTYGYLYKIIRKIVGVFEKRGIPMAVTFGNHDSELNFHREIQMAMYLEYDKFYGTFNAEEMYGCGTCNLPILSRDGSRKAFNLWLFDSGDYVRDENAKILEGYDYVHPDQIAWYEKTAAALKAENGGVPLPAVLFQHIPVRQEYDFLRTADAPVPGTNGFTDDHGVYHYLEGALSGRLREMPCPPAGDHREQFDSWVRTGDIVAAFFGHDHVNDFIVKKDGVLLVQTLCAGQFTYGKERGCRSIILHEDDPRSIETRSIEILPD